MIVGSDSALKEDDPPAFERGSDADVVELALVAQRHRTLLVDAFVRTRWPAQSIFGPVGKACSRALKAVSGVRRLDANTEPESPCIGTMIEPLSPETHDVSAPGFLLKGLYAMKHGAAFA